MSLLITFYRCDHLYVNTKIHHRNNTLLLVKHKICSMKGLRRKITRTGHAPAQYFSRFSSETVRTYWKLKCGDSFKSCVLANADVRREGWATSWVHKRKYFKQSIDITYRERQACADTWKSICIICCTVYPIVHNNVLVAPPFCLKHRLDMRLQRCIKGSLSNTTSMKRPERNKPRQLKVNVLFYIH